jgi:cell division protein FtsL
MLRSINVVLVLATAVAAYALYAVKYDTRRIEADLHHAERKLERLEDDIAVLKAERAHLARPERIEKLARDLGLRLPDQRQYVRIEDLRNTRARP